MHGARTALLVALFLVSTGTAQTLAELDVTIEPSHLTIDPRKHIQRSGEEPERQFFDVHIKGTVQCQLLTQPPLGVPVNATGAGAIREGSEDVTYFDYEPRDFPVFWEDEGNNRYSIDHTERITVIANGAPPGNGFTQEIVWWAGPTGEGEGTPRCDPQGYAFVGNGTNTVFIPGTGDITSSTDDPTGGSEPSPIGAPLAFVALAVAAVLRGKE